MYEHNIFLGVAAIAIVSCIALMAIASRVHKSTIRPYWGTTEQPKAAPCLVLRELLRSYLDKFFDFYQDFCPALQILIKAQLKLEEQSSQHTVSLHDGL